MKTFFLFLVLAQNIFSPSIHGMGEGKMALIDPIHGYRIEYPEEFEVKTEFPAFGLKFYRENGPALITLQRQRTASVSPYEWVKRTNAQLPDEEKIRVSEKDAPNGTGIIYLDVPVKVDMDERQHPVYANQRKAAFMEEGYLYAFTLREQTVDPGLESVFERIAESFRPLTLKEAIKEAELIIR